MKGVLVVVVWHPRPSRPPNEAKLGGRFWAGTCLAAQVARRSRASGGKRRDGNISAPKLFMGLGIALTIADYIAIGVLAVLMLWAAVASFPRAKS